MQHLMETFWALALETALGIRLLLTEHCRLFWWPQSGFSASLTICCMLYTCISSLNLEPACLPHLFPFLSLSN